MKLETLGHPHPGGGIPLDWGMDSRYLQLCTAAGCCFHTAKWGKVGLILALRDRTAEPGDDTIHRGDGMLEMTAFTEALTSRNGLSLAVKTQMVEEACQNANFICIFMKSLRSSWGGATPFPKDTG